jgi:hypothetical protein
MKRSFRAATVFTGAAACAAGLAPAAHAAPMAPGATASITAHNCGQSNSYSLHLYYALSENHPVPACIGSRNGRSGAVQEQVFFGAGKRFAAYCAGAYSGDLIIHGSSRHFTYGTHSLYGASVEGVFISRLIKSKVIRPCPSTWPPFG